MINTQDRVYPIVMTAMMICIIMVSIILFRIPIPFTQGYVNLSDAMVFLAVIMLGYKYGAVAAGIGGMLGDLMAGFAIWAPWTFVIKASMALIFGLMVRFALSRSEQTRRSRSKENSRTGDKGFISAEIIGMILAGSYMTAGYYVAEGIMYGNWIIAALGIPWNIAQFAVGIVLSVALSGALARTSLRSVMAYTAQNHSH